MFCGNGFIGDKQTINGSITQTPTFAIDRLQHWTWFSPGFGIYKNGWKLLHRKKKKHFKWKDRIWATHTSLPVPTNLTSCPIANQLLPLWFLVMALSLTPPTAGHNKMALFLDEIKVCDTVLTPGSLSWFRPFVVLALSWWLDLIYDYPVSHKGNSEIQLKSLLF